MRSEWPMAIVGVWSFSGTTQWDRFDPTQCACSHDMSNPTKSPDNSANWPAALTCD